METLTMRKSTAVEIPGVLDEIVERKSRRAYAATPVEEEKIASLFEAARWAPSSVNEQPWVYVYADKSANPDLWSKIFDSLMEGNKIWAKHAPLLIASFARKNFSKNDRPNGAARYDLGAANALLSLQATKLGLNVHQMGGFDQHILMQNLNVPQHLDAVVVMAVGYLGDAEQLPENLRVREDAPRERYTQQEFVLNKAF